MRCRWLPSLLVLGLLALPALAQSKAPAKPEAASAKETAPTLVVRLAPIEELLASAEYLASFTEFEERLKELTPIVKGVLPGIDGKKPLGLVGYLNKELAA